MEISDDIFVRFWKTLNDHSVKYIMVGGFAVNIHGFNRSTADMDVWAEDTIENRERLANALEELKIAPARLVREMQFIPGWTQMNLPGGFPLDIMTQLKGVEDNTFDECLSMAIWAQIDEIKVPFLHLNQLIAVKKAANRPKDRIDIEELSKIRLIQKIEDPENE